MMWVLKKLHFLLVIYRHKSPHKKKKMFIADPLEYKHQKNTFISKYFYVWKILYIKNSLAKNVIIFLYLFFNEIIRYKNGLNCKNKKSYQTYLEVSYCKISFKCALFFKGGCTGMFSFLLSRLLSELPNS